MYYTYEYSEVIAEEWVGTSMLILQDFQGAGGLGHVAIALQDADGTIRLYSRNGPKVDYDQGGVVTKADLKADGYDLAYKIPLTANAFGTVEFFAEANIGEKGDYVLVFYDCNSFVCSAVNAAGKSSGVIDGGLVGLTLNSIPSVRYFSIVSSNNGFFVPLK